MRIYNPLFFSSQLHQSAVKELSNKLVSHTCPIEMIFESMESKLLSFEILKITQDYITQDLSILLHVRSTSLEMIAATAKHAARPETATREDSHG